jgi:hypothetical protein
VTRPWPLEALLGAARRVLVLGIGGGGDVVGALALGRLCEALGTAFELGGVSWERFAIDPYPGPRTLDEVRGGRRIAEAALLADAETTTPNGVPFSEAQMARFLGRETVLIDVSGGPATAAEGVAAVAAELDCDLALYVDVGGDALAQGDEKGLASPLCDAVMLAAAARAAERIAPLGAIFGAGCDGELSPGEVLERVSALGRRGAWLGTWGLEPAIADELDAAAREVPTEASLQAVRCVRGETGETTIRDGRRSVSLGPLGALTFFFDLETALESELPLARAVADAEGLEAARDSLAALGIRTELDYERSRAREGP